MIMVASAIRGVENSRERRKLIASPPIITSGGTSKPESESLLRRSLWYPSH